MRKWFGLCVLVGMVALPAAPAGNLSNRRAPGFSLPDTQGNQRDPQDFRGKVIVLDLMRAGCPNCVKLSGILEQVKAKLGDKIQVLSVVVPPDTYQTVMPYIKENNITSPVLFDSGQMTASYLKITPKNPTAHFPHLFLIDAEGYIRNDYDHEDIDAGKVTAKSLAAEIERMVAGGTPKKR